MKMIPLALTTLILVSLVAGTPDTAAAQSQSAMVKTIDLAAIAPGTVATRPARPGLYEFQLANVIPGKDYPITIERELVPIAVLPNPFGAEASVPSARPDRMTACKQEVESQLGGLGEEKEVPGKILDLVDSPPTACAGVSKENLQALIHRMTTRKVDGSYDLLRGELLRVIVTRDSSKTWTLVLSTGERGQWRVSYGFTFVPNEDEEFFLEENGDKFVITAEEDREDLDFAPSVMFTWYRANQRAREWQNGFTAGLGYDMNDPMLFAGWGWTYSENLTLTAGLAIHSQTRLAGRFDAGDELDENLDASQLLEETFGANAYFGISFRFGTNVHAERAKAQKEAAAARAAAAQAAAEKAAAEKKAAEAEAQLKAVCLAEAEAAKEKALGKCDQAEPAALDACKKSAEADAAVARVKCEPEPSGRATAARDAAVAAASAAELKAACLDLAQKTEAALKAACPSEPEAEKKKCEAEAEKTGAAEKVKCLQ